MSLFDIVDRNNTSFSKELFEVLKQISLAKDDVLKYHQKLVVEYVMRIPGMRGILAYHKVGSGKTILAVAITEALIQLFPDYKILFISNKSLHSNFRDTIIKYYEMQGIPIPTDWIEQKYRFVTLNAGNMLQQVKAATHGSMADLAELLNTDEDEKLSLVEDSEISLDDTIIIHDEWHNLLNSIANGSKNAIGLYDAEMRAKNIKIIALTGTPVINDPYELAIGFNTLAGPIPGQASTKKSRLAKGKSGKTKIDYGTLFGEDYNDFVRMFVETPDALDPDSPSKGRPRMKNRDKFCDRILGLVSYYGADTAELEKEFPLEFDIVINRVPMSHKQYASYITARDRELEENKRGLFKGPSARLKKSSTKSSSSYRVRSRQISNFLYPPYATETIRTPSGYSSTTIYIDRLKPESLMPEELSDWSPKFAKILRNIALHTPKGILDAFKPTPAELRRIVEMRTKANEAKLPSKNLKAWAPSIGQGLVYSQFLDEGIEVFGRVLEANGFTRIDDPLAVDAKASTTKTSGPSYAVISGNIDLSIRSDLVKIFKDQSNSDCSKICLLLVTASGSEGLDMAGRHVHVMEPYWHWARIRQVIARLVRFRSLAYLPEQEQTVQPYIYLSDYPKLEDLDDSETSTLKSDLANRSKSEATTDVTLYQKSIESQMLIEEFLQALRESSIDCLIHYSDSSCRLCSPTGKVLWHADIYKDIEQPSPCQPYKVEVLQTKSIKIPTASGIVEYKYLSAKDTVPRFFEYKPELKAYVEIYSSHPAYETLLEEIGRSKK